jgi:hypothetical protein
MWYDSKALKREMTIFSQKRVQLLGFESSGGREFGASENEQAAIAECE